MKLIVIMVSDETDISALVPGAKTNIVPAEDGVGEVITTMPMKELPDPNAVPAHTHAFSVSGQVAAQGISGAPIIATSQNT